MFKQKSYKEIVNFILGNSSNELNHSKFVISKIYLIKADAYFQLGDLQNCEKYLIKTEDENNFEFNDLISSKINLLKIKIGLKKNENMSKYNKYNALED